MSGYRIPLYRKILAGALIVGGGVLLTLALLNRRSFDGYLGPGIALAIGGMVILFQHLGVMPGASCPAPYRIPIYRRILAGTLVAGGVTVMIIGLFNRNAFGAEVWVGGGIGFFVWGVVVLFQHVGMVPSGKR